MTGAEMLIKNLNFTIATLSSKNKKLETGCLNLKSEIENRDAIILAYIKKYGG